jgi:hypothetical protein
MNPFNKNVRYPRVLTNWSSSKDPRFRSKGARDMCFASWVIHPTRYHHGSSKVTICPFISLHVTKVTKTLWIRSKKRKVSSRNKKVILRLNLVTLSMVHCIRRMCFEIVSYGNGMVSSRSIWTSHSTYMFRIISAQEELSNGHKVRMDKLHYNSERHLVELKLVKTKRVIIVNK